MNKILITAPNGFVGSALTRELLERGYSLCGAVRRDTVFLPCEVEKIVTGEINDNTDWSEALVGVETVVHLAARVHVMNETATDPLAECRRVNTEGTLCLAEQASKAGVKRFIFISSIKVNGESGIVTETDKPNPQDAYGLSKWEAEQGLRELAQHSEMEIVIIRPPLVYGPGVKGNFISLIKAIQKGIPLPFGLINNQRSMIALDNLVDFIALCVNREKSQSAAQQTYLVTDAEAVSTAELIRRVSNAYQVRSRLLPIPPQLLKGLLLLLGKKSMAERLMGSLVIKSCKAYDTLGWTPPFTMQSQLAKMLLEKRHS